MPLECADVHVLLMLSGVAYDLSVPENYFVSVFFFFFLEGGESVG